MDDFKPSVFSQASTWSQASWPSQLSAQTRSLAPFDPEETAELELAPKGWARQIRSVEHRSSDVQRLRRDEEVLCEAKRSLRSVRPGAPRRAHMAQRQAEDWNAKAFVHYKKKLRDEERIGENGLSRSFTPFLLIL